MEEGFKNVFPLSSGFMLTSILGFLISGYYVYPRSMPWGFTFMLFFMIMLIASLISMAHSPGEWPIRKKTSK
ncbi:hypothetical protein HYX09_04940 [Candidatus Woesearchaeota archaeon]|nr:hypothetical protein [Candidatus Woesearchaeota archaeon]